MTSHEPQVAAGVTVWLARTAVEDDPGPDGGPVPVPVLADLEEFCRVLREHGAAGDLKLPLHGSLSVTLGEA